MADGWGWDGWWHSWSDDGWADDAWKDSDAWKDDKTTGPEPKAAEAPAVPAEPAPSRASGPVPGPPGSSKHSTWLTDTEFQQVFGYTREEMNTPQSRGKKHDFSQLQRVCGYRVRNAEQAQQEAIDKLQDERAKHEEEKKQLLAKLEEASSSEKQQEAKVNELQVLLQAKNLMIDEYQSMCSFSAAATDKLNEEIMGLGYQLEVLEKELEQAQNDKKRLESRVEAQERGFEDEKQRLVARYKSAIAKWDLKVTQLRGRLASAKMELQLKKDFLCPVQLTSNLPHTKRHEAQSYHAGPRSRCNSF